MMNTRPLPIALLLLGACAAPTVIEQSRELSDRGLHTRAFRLLDEARDRALERASAVPSALECAWERERLNFLIQRAREYLFNDYEDEALVALAAARVADPGNREIRRLRERAITKKARRLVALGEEQLKTRNYEGALADFLAAERMLPTLTEAIEGQWKVHDYVAKQTARAQEQFLEAVRKLPEFRYVEVRWHSSNALANDPKRDDAEEVRLMARRELAKERLERARQNRADLEFGAALIEFRAAEGFDPDLPGVDDEIAEMERELAAGRVLDEAKMHMLRQEFAKADEKLQKAYEMSVLRRGDVVKLMNENRRRRADRDYGIARDFEYQGMKREALEAYRELHEQWPDGLSDEAARIEALETDITAAEEEWQLAVAAEKEGKLEEALEHYRASKQFYAKLHDARARIEAIERRLAETAEGGGS